MNVVKNIAKNVILTGFSQITTSILGFILLIYIAKYLGEVEFGKYSFALSFTSLFVIFADIGISNLVILDIARNKKLIHVYLTNVIFIKFLLSFFALGMIIFIINLMDYPQETRYVVYLFGIYTILTTFTLTFSSIFQAFEKMEYVVIVTLIDKIVLFLLVMLVQFFKLGLIQIASVYILVALIEVILSIFFIIKKIVKPRLIIDFSIWKTLVIGALPFGLNTLFGALFFKIDTIMLSTLKGDAAVGIYNAAYTPLLSLSSIVSYMLLSAIYPVMARFFVSSKDSLKNFTILSSKYIVILGFPIAIGCFVLAARFIELFYEGQYIDSILAFQILSLFIPIRLVSSITGTLLTSINKQGLRTVCVGFSALINIILNLLMIPYISYIGASIATVVSEIFLYFLFNYFIHKHYQNLDLFRYFIKPLIASLVMASFIFYLKNINIVLLILLSCIIYFVILTLLGTFTREDRIILSRIVKKG